MHIASVSAPAAIEKLIRSTIRRCGWFEVVNDRAKAEYVLQCQFMAGPPAALQVRADARSGTAAHFRQTSGSNDTSRLVYLAVDRLIYSVTGNKGLCASKIAFAVGTQRGKEIFTCNFDGTGAERVTHNQTISTEPSWGPRAATLVYTLYDNNATIVALVDMLGKRQRRLSRFPGLNAGGDLSPDGRFAAVSLSRDGRVELYILELGTGRLRRLTSDEAVESSPCWSPNGREICYVSDRQGKPQLYIISTGGGNPRRVLSESVESVSPDWSSVANKICFSFRAGGEYSLAIVDAKGGEKVSLTNAAGDWESPSWAPDGRHIICSRRLQGKRGLYMVDSWHKRLQPVTSPGDHSLPSWSELF
ncbi:MAG: hypothetical protein HN742_34915 [Lentisphaerae bacterium]|nr:hypothetical protein [Lentisphaerota bacterium]MBT4822937.1 hypothetical protein [Lentisphaerota bacterium]MBT5609239.1 hypothetical protein [Lentisphaerota bacterium]MBT7059882.1 hypothetical protein [Lentisphaerota bacterium]MBT7847115.1 hypothetical protein [Lentisphaerota bacterium]